MEFLSLIIWILCGIGCYNLAEKKGYNKLLAMVIGILFGLIALAIYACLSNKNTK